MSNTCKPIIHHQYLITPCQGVFENPGPIAASNLQKNTKKGK